MISEKWKTSTKWYYRLALCGGLPLAACIVGAPEKSSEPPGPDTDTTSTADSNAATETNFVAGRNPALQAARVTEFEASEVARPERTLASIANVAPELRKVPNHDATISKSVASTPTAAPIANTEEGSLSVSLEK